MRQLLPDGAPLMVAVDDTLFEGSRKKVFGATWQHDGAAKGRQPVRRGTRFGVLGPVVELPFPAQPVCLLITSPSSDEGPWNH